jgi:hypothetical protein
MDTNKLFKAIQIIVQEEVKKEISLIKEEIRKEVLAEVKQSQPVKQQSSLKSLVEESADPFDLANKILNRDREDKQYSSNPLLNQVLNETRQSSDLAMKNREMSFKEKLILFLKLFIFLALCPNLGPF